jgi:hypothetical protein
MDFDRQAFASDSSITFFNVRPSARVSNWRSTAPTARSGGSVAPTCAPTPLRRFLRRVDRHAESLVSPHAPDTLVATGGVPVLFKTLPHRNRSFNIAGSCARSGCECRVGTKVFPGGIMRLMRER